LVVRVRLVAGVDDPPPQRGLQARQDLDVVGALRDLEAGLLAGLADAHAPGPAVDLPRQEMRGEAQGEGVEIHVPPDQVVLVGTVGGALAVDVVLVELEFGVVVRGRRFPPGPVHHHLPRLVPDHRVERRIDLGGRVLGVGVVDVEPGPVGQDAIGHPEFPRIVAPGGPEIEAAGVAERRLGPVAPPDLAPSAGLLAGIGVRLDHLRRGDDGAQQWLAHGHDAELDLRADYPSAAGHRSPSRSGMDTSTTRSPRPPLSRAHSCGFEVLGRSVFSANSASTASRKSSVVSPRPVPCTMSLMASFLARSTMLRSIAPEVRSARWREDVRPEAKTRSTYAVDSSRV